MTERTKQDALVEMNRIKGRCTPKASNELTTLMEKTSQYFEKRLGELQKQAIELGINPDPQNESILDTHGTKSESDKL